MGRLAEIGGGNLLGKGSNLIAPVRIGAGKQQAK
jgi:hypothetical protein